MFKENYVIFMKTTARERTMSELNNFPKTEFGYIKELALFSKPMVNTGITSYKWVQYRPVSTISNSGVLQFTIPGTSKDYVNLKNSYLQIAGRILKGNEQPIKEDDCALENLALQTLWSQVDVSFQQEVISSKVGTNYAYKSYLDIILNSSEHVMLNQLTSQLFHKDDAGLFDRANANSSYRLRKRQTRQGREIQLEGPLYVDICQQERPILNGVEINIKFWPNKPSFYISSILADKGYYFQVTDAILNVCMVEVSPAILVGHAAALKESPALYPFHQSEFKAFSIPKGQYDYTIDNIFQGDVPSDLVVGLVSSRSYIGNYEKNPFNFHNYDCNYCGFFINGSSTPAQPFTPRYSNNNNKRGKRATPSTPPAETPTGGVSPIESPVDETEPKNGEGYVNSYLSLFGQNYHSARDIPISMSEYPYGFCLYKFQVSENEINGEDEYLSVPRRGHTRLTLKFQKPLPESVTVVMYAHFPRILQIDESRNVSL